MVSDVNETLYVAKTVSAEKQPAHWNSINWTSSQQENFTIHYSTINDNAITASVAEKGLVLVYKKTANSINALPFDKKGISEEHWYYQVSPGKILINCDAYGSDQSLNETSSFQYFIISAEKLNELEASDKSRIDIMELSYEQASTLLN